MDTHPGPDVCGAPPGFVADLNDILTGAITYEDVSDVLDRTLQTAIDALQGDRGFIAIVEFGTGELVVRHTAGLGWSEEKQRLRLSLATETRYGITGHVSLTGQSYLTGDVLSDPLYIPFFQDVRSEIASPIMGASGRAVGAINIESCSRDAFTEQHLEWLAALANAASLAMRLHGFRARESALVEIGNHLTTALDRETLLRSVVETASTVLRYEDCSVFLLDPISQLYTLRIAQGTLSSQIGLPAYRAGEGLTGLPAQTGDSVRVAKPIQDRAWAGADGGDDHEAIGALLATPIMSRGRVLGVIRVLRRRAANALFSTEFTEGDERVLEAIASQVGAGLENVEAQERLVKSERMAAWGDMSARSAHMIGNRCFAIRGHLNELGYLLGRLEPGELTDALVQLEREMSHGLTRLEEILREFRDFVVATQILLEVASLNDCVREAVDETMPKRGKVQLVLGIADDVPDIPIDRSKLKHALGELVENAVSFMPDGGILTVATAVGGSGKRSFGRFVEVTISDTGPGVPADAKDRIFQPFYTSRVQGMGLGLSIVKGIIEAHHGTIREIGTPGSGAVFQIQLPIRV